MYDTPQFIEQVTEDHVRAMVHQLTHRVYDPLSARERAIVYAVAVYQLSREKAYAQVARTGGQR